jgi:hypothetical protein
VETAADLIPEQYRTPGLSTAELAVAQEQAEAVFPDDLCELLMTTLPAGDRFPDWRARPADAMRKWREDLVDNIHFDVTQNNFWLDQWGDVPSDPQESRQIVADALAEAPTLIPIMAHRAIPNDPLAAGNPVFSVWQTDIILYGANLTEYLANEFKRRYEISPETRTIRFWSRLVDLNNG